MSVTASYHHIVPLVVAVAVLLLSLSSPIAPSTLSAHGGSLHELSAANPCNATLLPHNYTGTVVVVGASALPTVSLNYSYDAVVITNLTNGIILSSVCSVENGTTVAGASGEFAFSVDPTPPMTCNAPIGQIIQCVTISGPYEQVRVAPSIPLPPGDFSSVAQHGNSFQVHLYPYLASVRIAPYVASATFSTGAADPFGAEGFTGAGNATPMPPRFDWSLSGVGWTFVDPTSGPAVNVTAATGAGIGNLSVIATLNVTGGILTTPPASVELLAVSTEISSASLDRTVLDVGQMTTARVNGTAAAGYTYHATIDPGLGEAVVSAPCAAGPGVGGALDVACAANVTYVATGVAQPSVTLSNGLSSAVWGFPDVTVNPAPSVELLPLLPVGYAGAVTSVVVEARPGTGTLPYSEACWSSGVGAPQCDHSPGPTWTFASVYSAPGNYSASSWTIDAAGLTRSATTTVHIVSPLTVAIRTSSTTGTAGVPLAVTAFVSGGDLPAEVWWNATGASNPFASSSITSDGPLETTFVPSSAEFVTVSVVVRDGLGTTATAVGTWTIGVGAATAAVPIVLPSTSPVRAGSPFSVEWQALDSGGDVVHDFASDAEVELVVVGSHEAAPGWVNASGVGTLTSRLPGWFDVPSTAWIGGDLNVSVTSRVAGSIQVDLIVAAGLSSGSSTVGVSVLPDIQQLRLFDPRTAVDTSRENDTLWQVTDRFGNAAVGASVVVTTSFDGDQVRAVASALPEPGDATAVWVNFSAPGAWAGTVTVTDLAGDVLVPTTSVPGLSGPWTILVAIPLTAGVGIGAVSGIAAFTRDRRRRRLVEATPVDDETALQRLAEGRATVVDVVRRSGPIDLAGIATTWEPPPAPPDLADWVASLLTDGTLDARFAADGVARFFLAVSDHATTQVTFDLETFDRAQQRRDAVAADWESEDP
ncbi:MAG: hypothetical protein L3J68_03935 [Thermoplasmata archaeon]|nr:hypothetical protein [Thermoplasmata archaeon]